MSALKRCHDGAPSPRLDEDLNSRNLFTFGIDAMKKMAGAAVAVVGMNGVGAEAAKSLILANIGRVTLVDDAPVGMKDLSAHFYLSESDAGLNRARACHQRLQELNPNVEVRVHTEIVTQAFLAEHDAVVVCDGRLWQHVEWNSWCRTIRNDNGVSVAFVLAEARGACFRLFSDFGDKFESVPGDKAYCLPVLNLTSRAASGRVTVTVSVEGTDTPPQEGDAVMFSGVHGADDCEGQPDVFRVLNHPAAAAGAEPSVRQFDVHARGLSVGQYSGRGHVTRVVQPVTSTFHSLAHSLHSPENLSDRAWKAFSFDNRSELLHVAFAALNQIMQQRSLPSSAALDPLNLDFFVETCKTIHSSTPCDASFSLDDTLLRAFAATCGGVLNPIAAIAGSLAAQEAIKRCSQKYIPICSPQWFYYDALDVVPDISSHGAAEFEPQHTRYDSQIAVLGRSFQQLLGSSNVFVIGAGAIGCELLKNFAMMGVACSGGVLTVTDNDHIEKSNLSRQFLFRHHHIKQSKSKCAKESVQVINPHFK
jgi:ubiquitin-activating enzyme E1